MRRVDRREHVLPLLAHRGRHSVVDDGGRQEAESAVAMLAVVTVPQFLERFGSIEDGRAFGQDVFRWLPTPHGAGRSPAAMIDLSRHTVTGCVTIGSARDGSGHAASTGSKIPSVTPNRPIEHWLIRRGTQGS